MLKRVAHEIVLNIDNGNVQSVCNLAAEYGLIQN
jgi:hypothetical protein